MIYSDSLSQSTVVAVMGRVVETALERSQLGTGAKGTTEGLRNGAVVKSMC